MSNTKKITKSQQWYLDNPQFKEFKAKNSFTIDNETYVIQRISIAKGYGEIMTDKGYFRLSYDTITKWGYKQVEKDSYKRLTLWKNNASRLGFYTGKRKSYAETKFYEDLIGNYETNKDVISLLNKAMENIPNNYCKESYINNIKKHIEQNDYEIKIEEIKDCDFIKVDLFKYKIQDIHIGKK